MTDQALRRANRARAADPGDLNAQAADLRARMRSGELSKKRVELAAYCGDRVAVEIVGLQRIPGAAPCARCIGHGRLGHLPDKPVCANCQGTGWIDLQIWTKGLQRWGHMTMVRAGLAAAEEEHRKIWVKEAFGGLDRTCKCPSQPGPHWASCPRLHAFWAVDAYLQNPSLERLAAARVKLSKGARPVDSRWWLSMLMECDPKSRPSALANCVNRAVENIRHRSAALATSPQHAQEAMQAAPTRSAQVRTAMQAELIRWSLSGEE